MNIITSETRMHDQADQFINKCPVALIGIGCRFPGNVRNVESFWSMLCQGTDTTSEFPESRWNTKTHCSSEGVPGKMKVHRGAFLSEIDAFDADFFGVSPREAAAMDPQQRLLLETSWEALENAGVVPGTLAGSDTAVYIGAFALDYKLLQYNTSERELIGTHTTAGAAATMLSNRISHWFDFRGASMTLDTACSSSMVALDLACSDLWSGKSKLALAGGVNLMFYPEWTLGSDKGGYLSPDGRCKTFDVSADGYGRGEGVGILVLKPLPLAIRDNDRIYALIRGTAVNQDGHTKGITVPRAEAQIAVMKEACRRGGIEPEDIHYVEAHGTGTPVGDPVEARAIASVYSTTHAVTPCLIGSVKTNIGHLEAAAGVAGIIKASLCLYHGIIPPTIHFNTPNPAIDFEELGIQVVDEITAFPGEFTGVNSFGFGGTNAHVVLQRHTPQDVPQNEVRDNGVNPFIVPLSVAHKESMPEYAGNLSEWLSDDLSSAVRLDDLAWTLALRRTHHLYRSACVCQNRDQLVKQLSAISHKENHDDIIQGVASLSTDKKVVFVFSGMGSQWHMMGQKLMAHEPIFAETINTCEAAFVKVAGWSILDYIYGSEKETRIHDPAIAQPAIVVIQAALYELLRSWGMAPDVVIGHSLGELTAAYAAGALDVEGLMTLVYHRSRLQATLAGRGGMLAASLSEEEALTLLEPYNESVSIAAINSPASITFSGPVNYLSDIAEQLKEKQRFNRFLKVDVPYHSRDMEEIRGEFLASINQLSVNELTTTLYSSVSSQEVTQSDIIPDYWYKNLRQPVCFGSAIQHLLSQHYHLFFEISPHPVLIRSIQESMDMEHQANVLPSLKRNNNDVIAMKHALAQWHCWGYAFDWECVQPGGKFCSASTYAWHHRAYWQESDTSHSVRVGSGVRTLGFAGDHQYPLLGARVDVAGRIWQSRIHDHDPAYLKDHCIQGHIVFPAAGYLEMCLAAIHDVSNEGWSVISDIRFEKALILAANSPIDLQFDWHQLSGTFSIKSRIRANGNTWMEHATGRINEKQHLVSDGIRAPLKELKKRCRTRENVEAYYDAFDKAGYAYGPQFRHIKELWGNKQEALAEIVFSEGDYVVHPVTLDAALQVLLAACAHQNGSIALSALYLPVRIGHLIIHNSATEQVYVHASVSSITEQELDGSICIYTPDGDVILEMEGVICKVVNLSGTVEDSNMLPLCRVEWGVKPYEHDMPDELGTWVIFEDDGQVGELLAQTLERSDARVVRVTSAESWQVTDSSHVATSGSKEELTQLFDHVKDVFGSIQGIVYTPSVDTYADRDTLSLADSGKSSRIYEVLHLMQVLQHAKLSCPYGVSVITRNSQHIEHAAEATLDLFSSPILGLLRVVNNEVPELKVRLIDLESEDSQNETFRLVRELVDVNAELETALRNDERYVKKLNTFVPETQDVITMGHVHLDHQDPYCFEQLQVGQIESIQPVMTERQQPGSDEIEIHVKAVGLNFKDVIKAKGLLDRANMKGYFRGDAFGAECSGTVSAVGDRVTDFNVGDDVIAIAPGTLGSYAITSAGLAMMKPDEWAHEKAASWPIVYMTAWYALHDLARMKEGERVLIHSSAGGVGQAAIHIARAYGAEIYATAGTEDKRRYLEEMGIQHVYSSKTTDYVREIKLQTDGRGVDVVLNALSGALMQAGIEALAPFGRFVEIGKVDIDANNAIDLEPFRNNLSFYSVDIDRLVMERPDYAHDLMLHVIDFLKNEKEWMLPSTTFSVSNYVDAFKYLASEEHIGKSIIYLSGESVEGMRKSSMAVRSDASYLITGGTSGLGLAMAEELVRKGARYLALVSRSGLSDKERKQKVKELKKAGVHVAVYKADITSENDVAEVMVQLQKDMPMLKGVIHSANIYDDAYISNLTDERLAKVLGAKALGAWHLHMQTQHLDIDFFVMFSSIISLIGLPAEASYTAGNAFLDSLAVYRMSKGLPALTVNLGAIDDVGHVAENDTTRQRLEQFGIYTLPYTQVCETLWRLIKNRVSRAVVANVDWNKIQNSMSASSRGMYELLTRRTEEASSASESHEHTEFLTELSAIPEDKRLDVLKHQIAVILADVLKYPADENINYDRGFFDMGLDSMLTMEYEGRLNEELGGSIAATVTFRYPTVNALADHITGASLASYFNPDVPSGINQC